MSFILTILSAVIIFILSQFVLRLILEPIVELKKCMGSICYNLLYFRSKLTNASSDNKISNEIKICSSKLIATYSSIPFYKKIHKIFSLPSDRNLFEASRNLNLIRAYMIEGHKEYLASCKSIDFPSEISNSLDKVSELLNIPTSYQEKIQNNKK